MKSTAGSTATRLSRGESSVPFETQRAVSATSSEDGSGAAVSASHLKEVGALCLCGLLIALRLNSLGLVGLMLVLVRIELLQTIHELNPSLKETTKETSYYLDLKVREPCL